MIQKPQLFTEIPEGESQIPNGDNITYLLLLEYVPRTNESIENYRDWAFIEGRQRTYDYIRDALIGEDGTDEFLLDVDKSIIYADNPNIPLEKNKLRLSNGINLYKFMKDCYVLRKVVDEGGFDIEEFHFEEEEE